MDMLTYSPAMTVANFAKSVGVSEGVVIGWIKREYVPTLKIGRHRLVNVAKFHHFALTGSLPLSCQQEIELEKRRSEFQEEKQCQLPLNEVSSRFAALSRSERRLMIKKYGSQDAALVAFKDIVEAAKEGVCE